MRIALIGQPNCGKSTLFNQVAGYRAETGNFSGTTVTFTETKTRVLGQVVGLVDLPGTYTLTGTNQAEREVFHYLTKHHVDVVINVVDASHLSQGMELTLELLELHKSVVLALNMVDEARRLGVQIDIEKLSVLLGIPVVPLIASRGQGVKEIFINALKQSDTIKIPQRMQFSHEVESAIDLIMPMAEQVCAELPVETAAIKLLEGDEDLLCIVDELSKSQKAILNSAQKAISHTHGQEVMWVISGERHARAAQVASQVVTQGERRITWRDRLDDVLLHPFWGYIALVAVLFIFFEFVFNFGRILEGPLLQGFDSLTLWLEETVGKQTFWAVIVVGLVQGVSGGIAIVLPYLAPFLLGLGLLEDVGYLPRVAFLMDALMHRMGLHGKAIVPFILGFGCNVPAIMSTRIMEDKRDRYLAAALATLVPCAARLAVVFGLVAFYLGPGYALIIYLYNLLVIAVVAKLLTKLMPEDTPGLILEMPVYRRPTLKSVTQKAWFRIREFIVEAWPILIVGSLVLSILNYLNVARFLNALVRPISWVLGLPNEVGVPLIFGILRKELSLVMLRQALGVTDFGAVLSSVQMMTFAVFVVFYIPCLATLVVLRKELGTKSTVIIALMTVVIAIVAALIARVIGMAIVFVT